MQYEIYEAKVKKVSAFLVKLYSHIALIITILAVLAAAATAAVAAKGSIVAESEFAAEIEYGSQLSFEADAIFGDAQYEYRVKGTEEWTDEAPICPGTYEIRAYAMTSFGTRRYGDVHTFTIKPRELTLKVDADPVQYGDLPTVKGNTVYGDTISACTVILDQIEAGSYTVKAQVDKDTLVILDKNGNDVTSFYTVADTADLNVTLKPRPLQVTVETLTEEYNGQPFSFSGYEITGGELLEGDTVQVVFKLENDKGDIINQLINVGTIASDDPTLTFTDKNGADVTHLYEVEIISGTLTVNQRPLVIQTGSGELTYSGTRQNYLEYHPVDDFLLEGHTVKVITEKAAAFLDCDEYENSLSFVIVDKDGNDVSSNYSINVGYGKVTVKPRKVTVTTLGTEEDPFVYDGQDHELNEFNVDNATEVDECATTAFSVRDVGTYENKFEVSFFRGTENVSHNYEIEYVYGDLEVVPRKVSLKLTDASREYDGTPLTSTAYNYLDGSLKLLTGHTLTINTTGSVTRPDEGTVSNDYVEGSAVVTDAAGTDVTANYDITVESSTLSIEKRKIKVEPISVTRVYNGKMLEGGYKLAQTSKAQVEGHTLEVEFSAKAKVLIYREEPNVYQIVGVTIRDADGVDVSAYYDIDYSGDGELKIDKRPLYLQTPSASKVYDGTPLVGSSKFIILDKGPDTGLVAGDELFSVNEQNGTLPFITNYDVSSKGTILNKQEVMIENNGISQVDNYDIHIEYGSLTITRRKITLTTETLEKMYDGEALFLECVFTPAEGTLADGQWLKNVTNETFVNGGWQEILKITDYTDPKNGKAGNNVQYAAVMAGSTDVTVNYEITYEYGTLTVTKRPILLRTETITRMYNGKPLTANDGTWSSLFEDVTIDGEYFGLVNGHRINLTGSAPSVTDANDGPYATPFENALKASISRLDEKTGTWKEVTGNYDIRYEYGTLTVTKRPITLTSVSGEWVYDGQVHSVANSSEYYNNLVNGQQTPFYIVSGSLADGQILSYMDYDESPSITDVGTVDNSIQAVIRDGIMGVTQNYDISYEGCGTLTVTPRHITVQLSDADWIYDGQTHVLDANEDFAINYGGVKLANDSPNGIVWGHTLSVNGLRIINAGTYTNEQTVTVLDANRRPVAADNYVIDRCDYGTVTVTPQPISIRLFGEKTYDGQYATSFDVDALGLLTGHKLTVSPLEKEIVDAGIWNVNPDLSTLIILDKNNNNVTRNYDPSELMGEYTVIPRPITILTDSAAKIYDGTPLTAPNFTVVTDYGGMTLVSGHKISVDVTGSAIMPGYHDNTADVKSFCVQDAKGRDVTANYRPAEGSDTGFVVPGVLSISADVKIRVTTGSAETIDDGLALTFDSWKVEFLKGELPNGFELEVNVTGRQYGIGSSKNTVTVRVTSGGVDVTELMFDDPNDIEYDLGTLTVNPAGDLEVLVLTPIYLSKTYDGTSLNYSDLPWDQRLVMTEQLQQLKDAGYTWEVEINGSRTKIGETKSTVWSFRLYDPDGNLVRNKYSLDTRNRGSVVIHEHKPVKVYLYSLDVIYNGMRPIWTRDDYEVAYGDIYAEWTGEAYELTTPDGEHLRIEIDWIQAPSASCAEWDVGKMNSQLSACISYRIYINGSTEPADPESLPLELAMFEGEENGVALRINRASIEITAASETREYDEENRPMLSNSGYYISKGALATDHKVQYANVWGEQYGVGGCENKIDYVMIVDRYGIDVTDNYHVSYVNGWLELTE